MTDKQIMIDGIDVSGCEFFETKAQVMQCHMGALTQRCKANNCYYKQLKAKEQECEELKKIIDEAKNSKLDLKSFLVGEAVQNEYEQQLDQLKAENEGLKRKVESYNCSTNCYKYEQAEKLKQTLAEIKPILEFYANSKIGEEQPDGTYKLSGGIWDGLGFCTTTYDPRPAREGLKKISEVLE